MIKIQKGYKQTEVGVIPEDWEVKKIKHVCTMKSGSTITAESISESEKYPCYGGNGLRGFTKSHTHSGAYTLIGRQGALCGNITFVTGDFFASEHAIVTTSNSQTNIKWLSYVLFRMNLNQYTESSAQPGLSVQKILELPIVIPLSKSEQTAIASALSDADALITGLEKLIEKKRVIKQGAMQELLRPKEGWEEKPITEIISLMTNGFVGIVKSHYSESDSGILYIQGYNVEENSFNFYGIKRVTHEFHNQHSKSCLQEGDLLTIQTGDIGITTVVPKELEGANCHALIITRFKKNKADSRFYSYYFNSFEGKRRLKEIETGSTMKHLNVGDMIQMWMPYPSKSEQTRIATLLSDMNAEITALEQKLGKYKLVKQGMMQVLLTGRIRLVESNAM